MSSPEIDAVCSCCGTPFRAAPVRSFLGFIKLKCPACPRAALSQLAYGYRTAYWVMLVLMTGAAISNLRHGPVGVPGLLAVVAIFVLVQDSRVRRAISARSAAPA